METTILVKSSSSDEPYAVVVSSTQIGLFVYCDCPAGEWGKYCKHKAAIVLGDEKILYDEEQFDNFLKAKEWIFTSNYPELIAELQTLERKAEEAKKMVKNQKERIARLMKEGLR